MVALVHGPPFCDDGSGRFLGVHITFIVADGRGNAPVPKPRKMLGPVGGGAVRIGAAATKIAVAEGIEEALTIAQACPGLSVWSGLSASHMGSLELPHLTNELIACANDDHAGRRCANRLVKRFLKARPGRTAQLALPAGASDFNDLMRGPA